ncbi:MAG: DUF1146 domain-containing protein [Solobacterium sp.]|nr:DUF1146 domain-containing protein [Solobacterium sp.]
MAAAHFYVKAGIYAVMFLLSFTGLSALDYSRFLKQGYTVQAQILYALLVMALAWMSGSFILSFIYM